MHNLASRGYPKSHCDSQPVTLSSKTTIGKCNEQRMSLCTNFIDLTKTIDLVSRDGVINILERIGYPARFLSIIRFFHKATKGTIQYDGSTSDAFEICSGVKEDCVLEPNLFGNLFFCSP